MATPVAQIDLFAVSPRTVSTSSTKGFDEVYSGLNVTPIGGKVYMRALPSFTTVTQYQWQILSMPKGSTAKLSATTGTLVSFRPDVIGNYNIALIPLDLAKNPTEAFQQLIRAGSYAGVGTLDTHDGDPKPFPAQCGTGFCHGGMNADPDLNVESEWHKSLHAHKVENHLNGVFGSHYDASCLPCHTVGFNTPAVAAKAGFGDVATSISFNMANIASMALLASQTKIPQFPNLPGVLQNKSGIQCESCHGPGSKHPSALQDADHGIAGVNLDARQCAQCHDSYTGHQQGYWQWSNSTHPLANTVTATIASSSGGVCAKCHTGEGFVSQQVEGQAAAPVTNSHGITCSTCHDPHYSDFEHQVRIAGTFTFDSGQTYQNPGLGGLCMRCHNSRVVTVATSMASTRGTHHGPQGDMMLGINGYEYGVAVSANSAHTTSVTQTCVTCHMAAAPAGNTPAKIGAHTWAMRDGNITNPVAACGTCHAGLATYDRPASGDFDGNGVTEGVQTEIHGLMAKLLAKIQANITGVTLDSTGHVTMDSKAYGKLSDAYKGAFYNYNYIVNDGSYGIHNTSYCVQLLQRSIATFPSLNLMAEMSKMTLRGPIQGLNPVAKWSQYR